MTPNSTQPRKHPGSPAALLRPGGGWGAHPAGAGVAAARQAAGTSLPLLNGRLNAATGTL